MQAEVVQSAQSVDISQATVLAGVIVANIGALLTAFISLKVSIAKLEVRVDTHDRDIDAFFRILREENHHDKKGE